LNHPNKEATREPELSVVHIEVHSLTDMGAIYLPRQSTGLPLTLSLEKVTLSVRYMRVIGHAD
jgi:hypothetical protein